MFAEPLVFLPARPLDAEVVRDLAVRHAKAPRLADRDAVRLDLGWPIHVVVAAVPHLPPPGALSGGGEVGGDMEVEEFLVALLSIAESPCNASRPFVGVHLPFLRGHPRFP